MRRAPRLRTRPTASSRRVRIVVLALSVVIVTGGVLLALEWRQRNRSDEEKIRDTVAAFLDACIDADFEAVWDLHSTEVHETVAARRKGLRNDLDDEEFFVENAEGLRAETGAEPPEDLAGWYPWALPPSTLESMTLRTIEIEPPDETNAMVVLRPVGEERSGGRRWRAEFWLTKEQDDWRLHNIRFHFLTDLPAPPPPPRAETGHTTDGRACLTLGVVPKADPGSVAGHIAGTGVVPADLVVVFRADRDAPFPSLAPWLAAAAREGVCEIRIRAERRVADTRGTTAFFSGLGFSVMSMGRGDGMEVAFSIPDRVEAPDILLDFGRDPHPRGGGGAREGASFRTCLGPVEGGPLHRIPDLLNRPASELAVVLAPRSDASVQRVAYVGYALAARQYGIRPRLALPDPARPDPGAPSMLYNGLTPAEAAGESREDFPPVPAEHPALRRMLMRPRED